MGAEIPHLDGFGSEPLQRARREPHVGGIQKDQHFRLQAPHYTRVVLRHSGGIDALPVGMTKRTGKDGPESVIAVAWISDTEKKVHEEESSQDSVFRRVDSE